MRWLPTESGRRDDRALPSGRCDRIETDRRGFILGLDETSWGVEMFF
jgi:hypothetical protein